MSHIEVNILRSARKLIERPENWTKGTVARDALGFPVPALSKEAACYCAFGATMVIEGPGRITDAPIYLDDAAKVLSAGLHDFVSYFNDDDATKHSDILALFDKAILLAEESAS